MNLPAICSDPVDKSIFIKVRLMSERDTLETRLWQFADKVERRSFVVIPLLSNLQIQHQQPAVAVASYAIN